MISRRAFLKMGAAFVAAAPAVVLTGCAHPQLMDPGSTEEQIIARLGQPHARTAIPDGTVRLTYSHQPMGQAVWWLFLDASGRLARVEQGLSEKNFSLVKPGMTKDEVYALFGPCAEVYNFKLLKQISFMYRYVDDMRMPMALWVDFDLAGRVVSWTTSTDPWLDKPLPRF